jgi:tryptophan synthase alpha chain
MTAPSLLAPRLRAAFAAPRAVRAGLIPYLTAGYPDMTTSDRLIETLIERGADIVELGLPFSDPIADGPVVQRSAHEALLCGITPDHVFELAAAHSAAVPFVVLTYLNPVLAYGVERFFDHARRAGVEALVIPDLPLDEASPFVERARASALAIVPMATPTSTDGRLELLARAACESPFVYCVATTGVTGARAALSDDLPGLVARLRARTKTPLAVGFGVSTPAQAAKIARLADGVIIGSALIDLVSCAADEESACQAVGDLVGAAARAILTSTV